MGQELKIKTNDDLVKFNIEDQNNISLGQSQQAGIFLKENGEAGTVQQIDLVV